MDSNNLAKAPVGPAPDGQPPAAPSVADRLMQGMREHQRGHAAAAERVYLDVLTEFPDDANASHLLGMLRFQSGELQAGLDLVRRAVAKDPDNAHAWNNLGNMYRVLEQDGEAEQAYLRATSAGVPVVSAWYNLARIYEKDRRIEAAIDSLNEVRRRSAGFVAALQTLASLYYRLGAPGKSREVYRQWAEEVPDDPTPRHMLASGSGPEVPDRADDRFIVKTFDGFADSFDDKLKALGYRAPELLAAHLIRHPLYLSGQATVLDAGCGTGWCGPLLRSTAARLVGVDLSGNMLERARTRGVYDETHQAEVTGFMAARPGTFDIVISADVLCYFGRLEGFVGAARSSLLPGGQLCLSVEALVDPGDADFRLGDAGRYAHSRAYVERCLAQAGFLAPEIESAPLRSELGSQVLGYIVSAHVPKPR